MPLPTSCNGVTARDSTAVQGVRGWPRSLPVGSSRTKGPQQLLILQERCQGRPICGLAQGCCVRSQGGTVRFAFCYTGTGRAGALQGAIWLRGVQGRAVEFASHRETRVRGSRLLQEFLEIPKPVPVPPGGEGGVYTSTRLDCDTSYVTAGTHTQYVVCTREQFQRHVTLSILADSALHGHRPRRDIVTELLMLRKEFRLAPSCKPALGERACAWMHEFLYTH